MNDQEAGGVIWSGRGGKFDNLKSIVKICFSEFTGIEWLLYAYSNYKSKLPRPVLKIPCLHMVCMAGKMLTPGASLSIGCNTARDMVTISRSKRISCH